MSQSAKDKEKRRQLWAVAIVVIIALLGVNIWLLMSNRSKSEVIVQQEEQLDLADSLRQQLEEEYDLAMQELEAKAQENEQLREIVEQQKEKLRAMKSQIARNIKRGENTTSLLKEAKAQIAVLVEQKNSYLGTIDSLQRVNADLAQYTEVLKTEKTNLEQVVTQKDEQITEVVKEKQKVEEEKADLAQKVARGSVLMVRNMSVRPMKLRRSGKEVETNRARRVEQFEVCFDVIQNELTQPGRNKFLLRIITPLGETIAIEQKGSGTFSNQEEGGSQMRFTTSTTFEYSNDAPKLCIDWLQDTQLNSGGEYTFEVYNRGYLAGKEVVVLK